MHSKVVEVDEEDASLIVNKFPTSKRNIRDKNTNLRG